MNWRVVVVVAVVLAAGCGRKTEAPRHIVVISLDTLVWTQLRAFNPNAAELPTLDRLAEEGVRCGNVIAPSSWTLPSHASLFSGVYPDRHGAIHPMRKINPSVRMLGVYLKNAGFENVAFTDGRYLTPVYGFAEGFDLYDDFRAPGTREDIRLPRGGLPTDPRGAALFDRAIAYLDQRGRDGRPLFLFLHTYAIHDYFLVHPWMKAEFPSETFPDFEVCKDIVTGARPGSNDEWRRLRLLYDAEVRRVDRALARFLDKLREIGMDQSTLIVILSDHGEGFDPGRGRIHHGGRMEEDVLRVPVIFHGPGMAPRDVTAAVSLVDVMPTLLELAGVPCPDGLDGRSFADLLNGGVRDEGEDIRAADHTYRWVGGERILLDEPSAEPTASAVILDDFWYIRSEGGEALYSMADDPFQEKNLLPGSPLGDIFRKLLREGRRAAVEGEKVKIEGELREQLKSVGYLK